MTMCDLFAATVERHGDTVALRTLDGRAWTWSQYGAAAGEAAAGLAGLGLAHGDVLACWLGNQPPLHIVDAAALDLGAASLSLYPSATVERAERVLADAGARILVTEPAHVERAIAVRARGRTAIDHIVCTGGDAPQALGWDEMLDAAPAGFDLESRRRAVAPGDLAALIYAPDATDRVALTHAAVARQSIALRERLALPDGIDVLSTQPPAGIAARIFGRYLPILAGWAITCCPDPRVLAAALRRARPGFFGGPPRAWERLRAAVRAGADELERAALTQAIERTSRGAGPQQGEFQAMIRQRIGFDRLQVAIVGAAPCPPELTAFWHACGVPLTELYASERCGAVAVAAPGQARLGTVGPPLPGCDVRIAADDEILVRGPAVSGAADAGWRHTGDAGSVDADGHLRVLDRLDELIVSAAGTRMSPASIEATVRSESTLIGEACVIGDGRPFNVALLTLARRGRGPRVVEAVAAEVARANARLSEAEQIKRFALVSDEWPADGEELTATMKPRRRAIAAKYASTIDALYEPGEEAISLHARLTRASENGLKSAQSGERTIWNASSRETA